MKLKECCIKAAQNEEEYCTICKQYLIQFEPKRQLVLQFKARTK